MTKTSTTSFFIVACAISSSVFSATLAAPMEQESSNLIHKINQDSNGQYLVDQAQLKCNIERQTKSISFSDTCAMALTKASTFAAQIDDRSFSKKLLNQLAKISKTENPDHNS